MKHIIRQPISNDIKNHLQAKQSRIDSGEKDHRWWNHIGDSQKTEISDKLLLSQGALCCYCECQITTGNIHIEHFEERHDNPRKVYDYSNLLLSCQGDSTIPLPSPSSAGYNIARRSRKENTTCGHKKSKSYHNEIEIDYNLLLNPTDANTQHLFSYINGLIEPAKQCSNYEKAKVSYTKSRMGLDSDKLNQRRDVIIKKIQKELNQMNHEDGKQYILSLIDLKKPVHTPYYSTIKDNFEFITI